jgi:hypothetical protein
MADFKLTVYEELLDTLTEREYTFQPFIEFLEKPARRVVMLRHDIDDRSENALQFAQIQYKRGIKGSYYFRMVPQSFNENIIKDIASMGHEIGYHYETMDSANGNIDKAYRQFCANLEELRKITSIRTICMHGSPRSPYDNKTLWDKYSYTHLGLLGEPYFDINFEDVAYLTDTGRRWNGSSVSIRDKVYGKYKFDFRTTRDIIKHIDMVPDRIMFTFHPQRWTNNTILWFQEMVMQSIKNQVKRIILSD